MSFIGKFGTWLANILLPLGGAGLFGAAVLDSSFIPLPEGVDVWLVTLSILQPDRMMEYVLYATLGSVAGSCLLYAAARWSEERFLEHSTRNQRLRRVQHWVEKNEMWAIIVGAILPPPMPFKLIVISAALVKGRFFRFLTSMTIGRLIRYTGEAWLAVHYGRAAWQWTLKVGPFLFGAVVLAGLIYYFTRRSRAARQLAQE